MTGTPATRPILSALGAFARAGLSPSTPLQRAIGAALLLKLVVVVAMRVFLFSGDARVAVTDGVVETQLIGPTLHARPHS